MRVLLAPCSYKGSLSATQAAAAMASALRERWPSLWVEEAPMADGGEGTLDALAGVLAVEVGAAQVDDPLGRPVAAHYARTFDGSIIVESAQACGLGHIAAAERDVLRASSAGVGQLIAAGLARSPGTRRVLLTLGGSATADGGYGMLCALGARATDELGRALPPTPDALDALAHLEVGGALAGLCGAELRVLCDVRSHLLGPDGAQRFFAQKGADAAAAQHLHARLARLVAATAHLGGPRLADAEGAGAAGGLGFAAALCGGHLVEGARFVANTLNVPGRIDAADLVFSGEGTIDGQTLAGKAPAVVVELARERGKPVVLLGGRVTLTPEERIAFTGIEVRAISEGLSLEEAMREAPARLAQSAVEIVEEHMEAP